MKELLLAQVEDVVLVDPGRDDHQRPLVDLPGHRLVLDQLHQVGLEHHLARRGGDVLAELEGALVGHRDAQLAVALLEVARAGCSGRFTRFCPPLATVSRSTCGLVIRKLEGASASTYWRVKNATFFSDSSDRPSTPATAARVCRAAMQVGLLDVVEEEIARPVLVLEARVALRPAPRPAAPRRRASSSSSTATGASSRSTSSPKRSPARSGRPPRANRDP